MVRMFWVFMDLFVLAAGSAVAQGVVVKEATTEEVLPVEAVQIEEDPQEDDEAVIQPAGAHELNEYLWVKRPLVVLADSPNDPRFIRQMDLIRERLEDLAERDVVVLTDTVSETLSPLREKLRPRGFMLVLIGKDGNVYLRKPFPWSVREISRSIDKMPLRQQEIRDRRS